MRNSTKLALNRVCEFMSATTQTMQDSTWYLGHWKIKEPNNITETEDRSLKHINQAGDFFG